MLLALDELQMLSDVKVEDPPSFFILQKSADGGVDRVGILHGRHMAGVGDFHKLRAADRCGHPLHLRERRDLVVLAANQQRRDVDLRQGPVQSGRSAMPCNAAAMPADGCGGSWREGRRSLPDGVRAFCADNDRGSIPSSSVCGPLSKTCLGQLEPSRRAFGRVGRRPRVAENQRLELWPILLKELPGDVAPHRQAAQNDGSIDKDGMQQAVQVVGQCFHGQRAHPFPAGSPLAPKPRKSGTITR